MPALSRRAALTTLPVLATCAAPVLAASPDAALIQACRDFLHAKAWCDAWQDDLETGMPEFDRYIETSRIIRATRPLTMDGWRWKAHAAVVEATMPSGEERPDACEAGDWAWSLMKQMLDWPGSA